MSVEKSTFNDTDSNTSSNNSFSPTPCVSNDDHVSPNKPEPTFVAELESFNASCNVVVSELGSRDSKPSGSTTSCWVAPFEVKASAIPLTEIDPAL